MSNFRAATFVVFENRRDDGKLAVYVYSTIRGVFFDVATVR